MKIAVRNGACICEDSCEQQRVKQVKIRHFTYFGRDISNYHDHDVDNKLREFQMIFEKTLTEQFEIKHMKMKFYKVVAASFLLYESKR